jgi:hypothetical protein
VKWINSFNQRPQYISLKNTQAIVFWSKNPRPLIRFLDEIDERDIPIAFDTDWQESDYLAIRSAHFDDNYEYGETT